MHSTNATSRPKSRRVPTSPAGLALVAGIMLSLAAPAWADVELPSALANNCVLQRDVPAPVWGRAEPGEKVTVNFADQSKTTVADKFGRWRVELAAMKANSSPRAMVVQGASNTVQIDNVYVGDVFLDLTPTWYVGEKPVVLADDADPAKLAPFVNSRPAGVWERDSHAIRPQAGYADDTPSTWGVYSKGQKYFPAEAFYLGLNVTPRTKAPIGLIGIGVSSLESMTPPQGFEAFADELGDLARTVITWEPQTDAGRKAYLAQLGAIGKWAQRMRPKLQDANATFRDFTQPPLVPGPPANQRAATTMYNRVIYRFTPGRVRGIILRPTTYDIGDPLYEVKAKALIVGLRAAFGQKDAPVCLLQLHRPSGSDPVKSDDPNAWVATRTAQANLAALPNVTVIPMYDLAQRNAMDPYVGRRVGAWAAAVAEGKQPPACPSYKRHRVEGRRVIVAFDGADAGLLAGKALMDRRDRESAGLRVESTGSGEVGGFELAGEAGKWQPARATIDGKTVVVTCEKIEHPARVRYAWSAAPKTANLYGANRLPAMPFCRETCGKQAANNR